MKLIIWLWRDLQCYVMGHDWQYNFYSDAAGTSHHRDCLNCKLHQELWPGKGYVNQ